MRPSPANPPIEVEAKFLGAHAEFERTLGWLSEHKGCECVRKGTAHRVHFYFDDGSRLRGIGCRLRCVVAPGEWCRYDFKADAGSGATLEVSIKKDMPAPMPEIIDELVEKASGVEARQQLVLVRNTTRMILALVGSHEKAIVRNSQMELEVSWDTLNSVETGGAISEVEVELITGTTADFENCMACLARDAKLERTYTSKLERFLGARRGGE